ncbi:MAG TPA: 2-oxoacid:acceptor oxidoreductase family protein, partial [Thermoclostridium caenicola]|nr:2-oxoacid:acceptor oxidoreductase family protein [Thermoclostridium caenicola]
DGVLIADSSLVKREPTRTDIRYFGLPATLMATDAGNKAFSNIYLMGKLIKETGIITPESFEKALYGVLPQSKHHLIPREMEALRAGMAI